MLLALYSYFNTKVAGFEEESEIKRIFHIVPFYLHKAPLRDVDKRNETMRNDTKRNETKRYDAMRCDTINSAARVARAS